MTLLIMKTCLLMSLFASISNMRSWGALGQSQVPCYFIFGDSLADPGNNNALLTISRANYRPYGIDFPNAVATGRFTNGRTVVDIIAQQLGFNNFIPRYVGVSNSLILNGVNYASGAGGIRDETGASGGARFSFDTQIRQHRSIVRRITTLLGGTNNSTAYLKQCIYTVGMGSNDYVNNYYMPRFYPSSRLYTPVQYANLLVQQFSGQLRSLYNQGARKVAILGVGQIGFTPVELANFGNSSSPTPADLNDAVELFNIRARGLVDTLNANLTGAKFTFLNTTAITTAGDTQSLGITVLTSPCCRVGVTNFTCVPFSTPCANRSMYAYYDNIHPTEVVNLSIGKQYVNASSQSFVHPYDISTLASL